MNFAAKSCTAGNRWITSSLVIMLSTTPPLGHQEFSIQNAYTAFYIPTTNLEPRRDISCHSTESAYASREDTATGCSTTTRSLISVAEAGCGLPMEGAHDQYIDGGGYRETPADVQRIHMDRNAEICDVSLPAQTAISSGHGHLNQSGEPRRFLPYWSTVRTCHSIPLALEIRRHRS